MTFKIIKKKRRNWHSDRPLCVFFSRIRLSTWASIALLSRAHLILSSRAHRSRPSRSVPCYNCAKFSYDAPTLALSRVRRAAYTNTQFKKCNRPSVLLHDSIVCSIAQHSVAIQFFFINQSFLSKSSWFFRWRIRNWLEKGWLMSNILLKISKR